MGKLTDYDSYDALELAGLVRKGDVTPLELLEEAIARTEAVNPKINAVVTKMYDEARQSIQVGLPSGPLEGVPFLLKDLGAYYKGVPVTGGSRFFADYVPDHDSELVIRYKKAGLVIFGKTNTPEFGLTLTTEPKLFGPSRNPWNLERTTGGSSGGAAAAVAARIVPVAHASDGGGSIRIPASCCGLFGLKPTRGRISKAPDLGEGWNGMSTDHVVSRTVRDSAAFLDAVAGPVPGDPYSAPPAAGPFLDEVGRPPGKLRIAYTAAPPSGIPVDPECVAAVDAAVALCEDLGHAVSEGAPEIDMAVFGPAFVSIVNANTRAALEARARDLGRDVTPDDVEHITWLTAEAGREMTAPAYIQSVQTLHRISRKVAAFFEACDILVSPVLLKPPVPLGYLDMMTTDTDKYINNINSFFGFTNFFNATGQPSMSVPLYWTADDLPVGLLFTARFGEEALLYRLAAQLEEARPWRDRRPEAL